MDESFKTAVCDASELMASDIKLLFRAHAELSLDHKRLQKDHDALKEELDTLRRHVMRWSRALAS